MKLLSKLRGLLIRLEIAFESHIDLTSEELVVGVLVADVHEHIIALKEELLRLLPQFEIVLFLSMERILPLF